MGNSSSHTAAPSEGAIIDDAFIDAFFERHPDAVLVTDDERRHVAVNPAACSLLGLSRERIIGRRIEELGMSAPPSQTVAADWQTFLVEGQQRGQLTVSLPAGQRVIELHAQANVVPGRHLAVARIAGHEDASRGSSLMRQLGEASASLAGALERVRAGQLAERASLAIDNALLYQAAQTAVRVRGDLLAVVGHDLRNPLSTILTGAALLKRWPEDPVRVRRTGDAIVRSVERMELLINDLVDFASIDAGRLSVVRAPLSPSTIVGDAVELMQPLCTNKGIALVVDVASDRPVMGDRDRLRQVFSNLIGNAIKFTPDGGTISLTAVAEHDSMRFTVSDTGAGIPASELPRVFSRHWRGRGQGGGTGLGLFIVRGIVEAHAGAVWVERAPGVGATFHVTLPASLESVDAR